MPREMLTSADGPVVISEKTLRALMAIRRDKLLPQLYDRVCLCRSNLDAMSELLDTAALPAWIDVIDDFPNQALPQRVASATPSEAATLRAALAVGASLILIDGPIKERAKLSYMKCEGVVSILVMAHRQGILTAVRPMVKALEKLDHADVLPPPEALDALWVALNKLEDDP